MKNTTELPKGIRRHGVRYQWNISVDGERYTGTAMTLDEALAQRLAIQKKAQKPEGREEIKRAKTPPITLGQARDLTIDIKWKGTKGEETAIKNSKTSIIFFGADKSLASIGSDALRQYVAYLEDKELAGGTINRKLSALSMIFRTAIEEKKIETMPTFHRKKEYKGRQLFILPEVEMQMLATLRLWGQEEIAEAVIVLIDTGMRTGELRRIEKTDVNFKQGKYGVVTLWRTKNDDPRTVPLTQRVAEVMKKRLASSIGNRLFPYKKCWMRRTWDRLREYLGYGDNDQFVPHILRHTCASRLVQKGVPLPMVQQWMGHKDIKTTMRYAHLAPKNLYDIVDVIGQAELTVEDHRAAI